MILGLLMLLSAQDAQTKASEAAKDFSINLSAAPEEAPPPAEAVAPVQDPATLEEQLPPEASSASAPKGDVAASRPDAAPRAEIDAAAIPPSEVVTMPITLSLDTPIKDLIADKRGRAVLDADMPGLSTDENLAKFQDRSLREFQPLTGGQLTDALMKTLAADLADPSAILAAADKKRKRDAQIGR